MNTLEGSKMSGNMVMMTILFKIDIGDIVPPNSITLVLNKEYATKKFQDGKSIIDLLYSDICNSVDVIDNDYRNWKEETKHEF